LGASRLAPNRVIRIGFTRIFLDVGVHHIPDRMYAIWKSPTGREAMRRIPSVSQCFTRTGWSQLVAEAQQVLAPVFLVLRRQVDHLIDAPSRGFGAIGLVGHVVDLQQNR